MGDELLDPLGKEAGRLCRLYDRCMKPLTDTQRRCVELLGGELKAELAEHDGHLTEETARTLREQFATAHLPSSDDFIRAVCLVNWPLPFALNDPPEEA